MKRFLCATPETSELVFARFESKICVPPLCGGHIYSSHAQWYWKFLVPLLLILWSEASPEWHLRLFRAMEAPFQLPLGCSVYYFITEMFSPSVITECQQTPVLFRSSQPPPPPLKCGKTVKSRSKFPFKVVFNLNGSFLKESTVLQKSVLQIYSVSDPCPPPLAIAMYRQKTSVPYLQS